MKKHKTHYTSALIAQDLVLQDQEPHLSWLTIPPSSPGTLTNQHPSDPCSFAYVGWHSISLALFGHSDPVLGTVSAI